MKKQNLTFIPLLLLFITIGCNQDIKEFKKIKNSENKAEIESFLSNFPESIYFDSVLINLEKLIYLKSINSRSKSGTFEEYDSLVIKYPRVKELTNAEKKLVNLKLKSDTIEIYGKLVTTEGDPVSNKTIMVYPLNEEGKTLIHVGEQGILLNPLSESDSSGEFILSGHRSFLSATNEFTLSVGFEYIQTDDGISIVFKIDTNSRVIDVGSIIVK